MSSTVLKIQKHKHDILALSVLILFNLILYRQYLSGAMSPTWDFLGAYMTNSIAWWGEGSFFNPPSYLPYAFSGYPAHALAQSSGWYLPHLFLAEFNLLHSQPLAVLQATTILFGIIGFYFFSKKLGITPFVAFIISIGYLFTPGFFSNASHVDIVRAWAFVPWLFISLMPKTKINYTVIILTTLLYFQFFIGVYPGSIVASAYILILFMILNLYYKKINLKNYLIFQILPAIAGLMMSLLKWIPLISEQRVSRGGNVVEVNLGIISTLIYPYETEVLPNDITMRSLFVIPLLVFGIFLIQKIDIPVKIFIIIGVVSIFLGIDFNKENPWQNYLPLLDESRFRTTDFKLYFVFSLLILAGLGIKQSLEKGISLLRAGIALSLALSYVSVLNFFAKSAEMQSYILGPGNQIARLSGLVFFGVLCLLILFRFFKLKSLVRIIQISFLTTSVFIGWTWAHQTPAVWLNDRVQWEDFYYGDTSENIRERVEDYLPNSRGERIGRSFPIPYSSELTFQIWNKSELDKSFTMGGLVSLKGLARYEEFVSGAEKEEYASHYELLKLPLQAWVTQLEKADFETSACIYEKTCVSQNVKTTILDWKPSEYLVSIEHSRPGLLVTNEVAWKGWQAEVCSNDSCKTVEVAHELSDKLVAVPISGDTVSVRFFYEQPFKITSWVFFWIGIIFMLFALNSIRKEKSKLKI